jgi:cellulose synthase/poly-beta-1,6-N-acetylglucosamine synthase-like glycosyltransferase
MYWLPLILSIPYILLLLYIYRSLLRIRSFKPVELHGTFVSVIVACRNEQKNIPGLLQKLKEQDYPSGSFEVIIVDDNSNDATAEVIGRFIDSDNIHLISNSGRGKKKALETGITSAMGELILTTDADCSMGKNWIRTIASFYEKNKPEMIIGPVQFSPLRGFFGRFQELEFLSLQGITAGTAAAGMGTMCNGANLAFTKAAYLNNKNNLRFDIATGDDVFLLHSMKKNGLEIFWLESNEAVVITNPSPDLKTFFRQRRRWASKSTAYSDKFSIFLGIVTFVTILIQAGLLVASFIDQRFLKMFLLVFILKSIPDFLMLFNTTSRYKRIELMKWFLPSQVVYPFYVLAVVIFSLRKNKIH